MTSITTDDVLRARVTTVGAEAHTIIAECFNGRGKQWTIYDVGGSRNQRGMAIFSSEDILAYPYWQLSGPSFLMTVCDILGSSQYNSQLNFHPVNTIIFLAPLSGFNQFLAEDETVNRLVRGL